jgi:hypothetical protein
MERKRRDPPIGLMNQVSVKFQELIGASDI